MVNARALADRTIQSKNFHNLPPVGTVMPREKFVPADVAEGQSTILRFRYGRLKSPAKEQSRDTGQSERACRNQQAGQCCMNLAEFFNACRVIPELQAWGAMMMGLESENPAAFQRELQRGPREIVIRIDDGGAIVQQRPEPTAAVHDLFERKRA